MELTASDTVQEGFLVLRICVKEFKVPPVHDGLVLGRQSPIGPKAIEKSLGLLVPSRFQLIAVEDDTVGTVCIRRSILKRVSEEALVAFVLKHLKPLMSDEDILHMNVEVERIVEGRI